MTQQLYLLNHICKMLSYEITYFECHFILPYDSTKLAFVYFLFIFQTYVSFLSHQIIY
jgi:hypothetical protein